MNERGWMETKRTGVQRKTEMKRTTLTRTVLTMMMTAQTGSP
jgi:hypothetical protein